MEEGLVFLFFMMVVGVGALVGTALRNHQRHLERMEELKQKNAARQLEDDLLSGDTSLLSAHLTAILERLGSIEQRLDAMDGRLRAGGTIAAAQRWDEEAAERRDKAERQPQTY